MRAYIDIETTGLNPFEHEIIEIAIITETEQYYAKIIPRNIEYANPKALEINGYNEQEWASAIPASKVAVRSARILDGCVIVGHNPSFDMGFLRELWDLYNCTPYIDRRYIDTVVLAREHLPTCRSYSLDHIRQFLGWSMVANHSALIDAQDCERLFHLLWRCSIFTRLYIRYRHRFSAWLGRHLKS